MADSVEAVTTGEARSLLMPPAWELLDWEKRGAYVHIRAMAPDGRQVKAHFETLPLVLEADPLNWLKQVISLELLWNLDSC